MGSLPLKAALRLLARMPRIRRRLRQLGIARHDVDDVAATILLAATHAWRRYDPALGTLDAWLDAIVRHQAAHHRTRAYVRRERPAGLAPWPPGEEPAAARSPPDEATDTRRQLEAVLSAFARLPALERAVLEGVIAGDALAEVAVRLRRPASTLYKALYRARAKLMRARSAGRTRRQP